MLTPTPSPFLPCLQRFLEGSSSLLCSPLTAGASHWVPVFCFIWVACLASLELRELGRPLCLQRAFIYEQEAKQLALTYLPVATETFLKEKCKRR